MPNVLEKKAKAGRMPSGAQRGKHAKQKRIEVVRTFEGESDFIIPRDTQDLQFVGSDEYLNLISPDGSLSGSLDGTRPALDVISTEVVMPVDTTGGSYTGGGTATPILSSDTPPPPPPTDIPREPVLEPIQVEPAPVPKPTPVTETTTTVVLTPTTSAIPVIPVTSAPSMGGGGGFGGGFGGGKAAASGASAAKGSGVQVQVMELLKKDMFWYAVAGASALYLFMHSSK